MLDEKTMIAYGPVPSRRLGQSIGINNIPPKTTVFELVPDSSPTIKPKVVITPEVKPKLKPVLSDDLILNTKNIIAK